jgi:hypothetical protein
MLIFYVMWEAAELVGQLLALQEGSAVGWMTKESSITFWQGKVFSHLQRIQTTSETSPSPIQSLHRAKSLGQEANHLSLSSARGGMYALYLQTTLYPHRVVLNESKRQLYLI